MVEREPEARGPEAAPIRNAARRGRARGKHAVWIAALLAPALAAFLFSEPRGRTGAAGSPLPAPDGTRFDFSAGPMALSSDGRLLAFVGPTPAGKNLLWVRPMNGLHARPLPGTEMASNPFWSPDGRFLAFFASGKLMKVRARRGHPEVICDAENGQGGSWNSEGIILFASGPRSAISRVSSSGGKPVPVTRLDAARRQRSHRWPFFLPDGRHFLYLEQTDGAAWESWENTICVGSLDDRTRTPLLRANSNAVFAPSLATRSPGPWGWLKDLAGPGRSAGGHILFWRDNTLLARPFDAKALRLTGEEFSVAAPVRFRTLSSSAVFSVSGNGALVYQEGTAAGPSLLAWFDRSGRQLEVWGASADYLFPRLSPDGRRAAVDLVDSSTHRRDVWILDPPRRAQARLTSDPGAASSPNWSPDGRRVVFSSGRKGSGDLYEKSAAGPEEEKPLLESPAIKFPTDWSPDGRFIAFTSTEREKEENERGDKDEEEREREKREGRREEKRNSDLWVLSVADRNAVPFLKTPFNEGAGQFSPDGRWIVYSSDESGRGEIYVQPFPARGERRRISTGGGSLPRWRRDGAEILYTSGRALMSVDVKTSPAFEAGPPRRLFELPMAASFFFDVTPDGLHILASLSLGEESSASLTLLRDWAARPATTR